jgi:hypothetical protein
LASPFICTQCRALLTRATRSPIASTIAAPPRGQLGPVPAVNGLGAVRTYSSETTTADSPPATKPKKKKKAKKTPKRVRPARARRTAKRQALREGKVIEPSTTGESESTDGDGTSRFVRTPHINPKPSTQAHGHQTSEAIEEADPEGAPGYDADDLEPSEGGPLSALKTVLRQELQPSKGKPTPTIPGTKPEVKAKRAVLLRGLQPVGTQNPYHGGYTFHVSAVDSRKIRLIPWVGLKQPPVPKLAYGLDRVLFNPGVYHLQDPRSRVFNFDPYLSRIMPVKDFDFQALRKYITSSEDATLINMAKKAKKKYTGSTSSMTSTLSHFHYLLSAWRPLNYSMISRNFEIDSYRPTRILRAPAATFLHWKDGVYAIDADKEFDTANVLTMLGKSMEKFLTLPKEEFEKYRKTKSDQLSDEARNGVETYHYSMLGDFLMRSQLDAHDHRLPGTGMFDLKTRAVISIRMDTKDYEKGMTYEIRTRLGQWESFEREYYDMIRSAFLKYSLQVRMGRMDGIFVAFHNTQRIFGFQYIPLQDMDLALHGQTNKTLGDAEFRLSVHLLNKVLDKVTGKYPGRTLRLHFETRGEEGQPFMYIFAKPVTQEEVETIQGAQRAHIEEYERRLMGLVEAGQEALAQQDLLEQEDLDTLEEDEEEDLENIEGEEEDPEVIDETSEGESSTATWEDVMLKVEDELEDEARGISTIRDAIEDALQESGLLRSSSPQEMQRYVDEFLEALTGIRARGKATLTRDAKEEEVEEGEVIPEVVVEKNAQEGEAMDTSEEPEEPTLKDLLVRLATQIRNLPSERRVPTGEVADVVDEDAAEYMQRLQKVERILSELTEKPLHQGVGKTEGETGTIETGSVSAEDLSEPTAEQASKEDSTTPASDSVAAAPSIKFPEERTDGELFGLILTIRNKVDGQYVERPEDYRSHQSWIVEYAMEELPSDRAHTLYKAVLERRKKLLWEDWEDENPDPSKYRCNDPRSKIFYKTLERYNREGRKFREKEEQILKRSPIHVLGDDTPYTYQSILESSRVDGTKPYEPWVGDDDAKAEEENPSSSKKKKPAAKKAAAKKAAAKKSTTKKAAKKASTEEDSGKAGNGAEAVNEWDGL